MHLGLFTCPMCPIRWCQNMAALLHYWSSRLPPNLQTLNIIWVQERGAQILLSLKVPGKRAQFKSPNGDPMERLALSRAFFCISLEFPNKQGLLIKQISSFSRSTGKGASPACPPPRHRAPMKTAAPFPQPIVYSFIRYSEQLYVGFSTSQDRM
jgi:hypothetical protein